MLFSKPAKKPSDLVAQITARGAIIDDVPAAYRALEQVGYYRISGYMGPFQTGSLHTFNSGTKFSSVLALYELDQQIRGRLMLAIEPIEVAFRAAMCNSLSKQHGAHWHTNQSLFSPAEWPELKKRIHEALEFDEATGQRTAGSKPGKHLFLDHYYNNYTSPKQPPCWMLMEVASFGLVARMFKALDQAKDRKVVADVFKLPNGKPIDESIFGNWIHGISFLRNSCAHHSRIVHKKLPFNPRASSNPSVSHLFEPRNLYIREFLVTTAILNKSTTPQSDWLRSLYFLLDSRSRVNIEKALGFKKPWNTDPLFELAF